MSRHHSRWVCSRRPIRLAALCLLGVLATAAASTEPSIALGRSAFGDPVCAPAPAGMVAWWAGEDSAEDILGSHHGTAQNGLAFAPGWVGRGFDFDGVDDSVLIGMLDTVGLTETAPLSITAWLNSNDVTATTAQVIAGNYMGEGGGTGNFSLYFHIANSQLLFDINQRQIDGNTVSAPISNGWHFVTATYDGSTLSLYLDALFQGSIARTFAGSTNNTRGWNVGNLSDTTNTAHGYNSTFNGLLDEVTIFDRALGAAEISAIHAAASAGLCWPIIFANGFETF